MHQAHEFQPSRYLSSLSLVTITNRVFCAVHIYISLLSLTYTCVGVGGGREGGLIVVSWCAIALSLRVCVLCRIPWVRYTAWSMKTREGKSLDPCSNTMCVLCVGEFCWLCLLVN